ncbi:LUD domain-containing protein [Tenacibaculum sp. 190524A02b]|uniref:Uncharacterized ACR, YkgG family COG1556 n=1 Tax=Tenacibaculum vairaonense TaxID=3137860 RepID=A0ABM9PHI8_9FLAO
MNFFKKLFKSYSTESSKEEINQQPVNLSLDDLFVHNFINKGGKFLYCTSFNEVIINLENIVKENDWKDISCTDFDLLKITQQISINTQKKANKLVPFFTTCEHLIANKGDILFSSNQLGSQKISELSENFIVYATTSQLVKNTSEGLTGIKTHFSGNIPTNISSVTNYTIQKNSDDFLNYGNSNSKNLYLLLFEDL